MKRTAATILLILLALTSVSAVDISGYVGISTGYEFNVINSEISNSDGSLKYNKEMNFQGVPFYLEGETYFCPWVGMYYGVSMFTFPTVLKEGDVSYKPFDDNAPTLYTSPYLGLALRYDFTDMIALVLNTGLSYTAWRLPVVDEPEQADYLHMMNVKCDLTLGIHPKYNMSVRIGLKVDTPVYTGFTHTREETGIKLGGFSAEAVGAKLVPYIGLGYAYGRRYDK